MTKSKGASKSAPVPAADIATKKGKSDHPTTIKIIEECIRVRCDKGGSSYQAIKKFIEHKYNLDMKAYATHIRKALKKGIEDGVLVQVSGIKGASSGSFKLAKTTAIVTTEKNTAKESTAKVPPSTSSKSVKKRGITIRKSSPTKFTDSVVAMKEKTSASVSKASTKEVKKSKASTAKSAA